jgi:hypothetical protein
MKSTKIWKDVVGIFDGSFPKIVESIKDLSLRGTFRMFRKGVSVRLFGISFIYVLGSWRKEKFVKTALRANASSYS